MDARARFRLLTPPTPGALAIIELSGDVDSALDAIGAPPAPRGTPVLRPLAGVDRGVVVRWTDDLVHLMPHGGPEIVRALARELERRGVAPASSSDGAWPEARDDVETLMLGTLARAESPLAIDLLLDQPRRWRDWDGRDPAPGEVARVSMFLNRLVRAPLVAAVGRPNVGKSTLTNALAARHVSIVAAEPGTTRDAVGVTLALAGLTVRWLDTPGVRAAAGVEADAIEAAREVVRRADLVVVCGDAASGFPGPEERGGIASSPVLRVGTRADLGSPAGPADVLTAAASGEGVAELASAVRERLVPAAALAWPGPWWFADGLPAP